MTLPLGLGAKAGNDFACGMNADLGAIEHLDAKDVEVFRGAGPHDLGEARDADSHQLASFAPLDLLLAQRGVADLLHGHPQGAAVIAAVVLPPQHGLVGKLLRLDEILETKLRGIDAELVRHDVRHALDGVDRFGDPERATVGDSSRRLVGVNAVHFHMRGLEVIRAGADVKETGRELGGVRGGISIAVIAIVLTRSPVKVPSFLPASSALM